MRREIRPIVSASVILLLTEAVFSCDLSFDPNTDEFTLAVIIRLVAPLFAIAVTGLIVLNLTVFFFKRKKFFLGVLIAIFVAVLQWVFWATVVSFDRCLDVFPYLPIIEVFVLLPLTIRHLFGSKRSNSISAQSLFLRSKSASIP